MNSDINKDDHIKIGLTFGVTPLPKDDPNIRLIYEAIEELIIKLKEQGITGYFVERDYEMNFILDSRNGKIILPEEELETKKFYNSIVHLINFRYNKLKKGKFL